MTSRSFKNEWEDMQKSIKILSASHNETKKLTSSLTAIRGEINKLKRPTEHPLEAELQPASKKKKSWLLRHKWTSLT